MAEPHAGVRLRPQPSVVALGLAAAAVVAGTLGLGYVRRQRQEAVAMWAVRLSAIAQDRQAAIDQWLRDGKGDVRMIAAFPSVREALSRPARDAAGASVAIGDDHLAEVLMVFLAQQREYRSATLLDNVLRRRARATTGPAPYEGIAKPAARDAIARRAASIDIVTYGRGGGAVLFAAPVLDPRDQSILGAAVLDADPESLLYPLLRPELLDATTGEIMLARREDDQALFLGPFRPAVSPPSPRVPLSAPGLAMARALAGERYFGEAVDFRGTKVLAMTGHLDEAPWGLVVKVDEAEALTRFRQGVAWQAVVALFLVAGALAMGFGLVRTQRAEREVALASARAQANAELEQRVQERTRQLAEANRDLEAFASSASHDLRAPLRVIDGFARALAEDHGERLDAEGRRILGVVRENARRMAQLIDALLAFSRAGQQELQRATVDMTALVRATYAELRGAEPTEGVELRLAELDPALGDPGLLRQVWANLLSNALKFTRPKGRRTIEVGSRNEALRVVYFVRDNGVGFDMHHAGKLFDVFQRLHGPKEFEGNGIGLALVSRIVSRHGGEVWAEGRPDEGATISFSLPRPNGG